MSKVFLRINIFRVRGKTLWSSLRGQRLEGDGSRELVSDTEQESSSLGGSGG